MTDNDRENLTKAAQAAKLLASDIKALTASSDPFLAEISTDLLVTTAAVEQRLNRLVTLASNS